jgi:hypothetical protein
VNGHPIKDPAAVVPLLMSALLILLLGISEIIPLGPSIPIHDEYLADHVAMLLFYGQVPIIVLFAALYRGEFKRAAPVLALQLSLLAATFAVVRYLNQTDHELVATRIRENTPLVGSEDALRRFIEEEQRGKQNHVSTDGNVARYMRRDLTVVRDELDSLGPLRSLDFRGIDGIGWDIYDVHFANGDGEFRIFMSSNGLTQGLTYVNAKHACFSSEIYECRNESRGDLR